MTIFVDIHKRLNNFSLDISFSANDQIVGLLGASGCGKSMTLKCIAGIETPDYGKIVLNGKTLFDSEKHINLSPQQRKVGYLFQNYALFPHMTVEENIGIGIQLPKNEKAELIKEKIKSFYLEGLAHCYPTQLSGGQQQRVALARIFAAKPEIIMLDEPFSALDSHLKWQVEQETLKQLSHYEKTIILVSHNRDEVYRLCEKTAVLSQGKVECFSSKQALFEKPQTLAASKLTGCKNHTRIKKLTDCSLYAVDWQIELQTTAVIDDTVQYVGIRAHFIERCKTGTEKNRFKPQIVQVIEDTFHFIIVIKMESLGNELVWNISKEEWREIVNQLDTLELYIPDNKILLLH